MALLAALYLWVQRIDRAPPPAAPSGSAAAEETLAAVEHDAITTIDVVGPGYSVSLHRQAGGAWAVSGAPAPPGQVPDAERLESIAWALSPLTVRRVATPGDLAQYGLSRPALRLAVAQVGGTPLRLAVGEKSAVSGGYYVQRDGDPAVYLWESSLPEELPTGAEGFFAATGGEAPAAGGGNAPPA